MKPTFAQRFRYKFDNLMSRGTPVLIGMLFLLSLTVIIVASTVISLSRFVQDGETTPLSFGEAAWESLMRTLDSGTMGGDTGTGYRTVMFFVTLGGIFIVSTLIGVLSNGIESQMDRLRKGRSLVLESNHTLVLGWSPQIFTVLNELMIANENQTRASIVVLADRDKVEMEDEIRERLEVRGRTRIICRSGNPIDPTDLEIASPHTAKSIIILPSENDAPDADVIKTVLAITNNPNRRAEPYHIVTPIRNERNMKLIRMVTGNDHVQAVLTGDLIARIMAQTSRQSGLSVVYTELMDFDGDEIYFQNEPTLVGKYYGDTLLAYEDSCVMGICRADGKVFVNPPMKTVIEPGDQIFALSQDDDTVRLSGLSLPPINEGAIRSSETPLKSHPEKCLILGWNRSGVTIVHELDNYVAPGSLVTVIAEGDHVQKEIDDRGGDLKNQQILVQQGEPTDRDLLNALAPQDYDHIIVLADESIDPQKADGKTFVTLLNLRDIAGKDQTPFSIVSEMLDLRNRRLAQVTRVDDFIVSDHLISLMMAQLSENAAVYDVFTDIFDPEGSEIYLKPVSDYVATGEPVNFYTVVEAARRRGQTAIGYRRVAEANDERSSYGVHTNPRKSEEIIFQPGDKVIVISEN
jgi:ion channel POLLUX/CASTOR